MLEKDKIPDINVAFNEASILGVEFDKNLETVGVTFSPVAIDINRAIPADNRIQIIFKPIERFVASYKLGKWQDDNAKVLKFEPEEILNKIQEFKQRSIYGWKFIDIGEEGFSNWSNKLSFNYVSKNKLETVHTIDFSLDDFDKTISIRIWFENFEVFDPKYNKISLETFIGNGKRGWDAIYGNDPAAKSFGIFPTKSK